MVRGMGSGPTTIGDAAPVALCPVLASTVNRVIGAPPLFAGGVKVTVACELPATALTAVGALGAAAGVTAVDAPDGGPVPTLLLAVAVKV